MIAVSLINPPPQGVSNMGDDRVLRAWGRAALRDADQLADAKIDAFFVLTYPEGGLEVATTEHGEVFLWVYSDVPYLTDACGDGQPYVPVTLAEFAAFADGQGSVVLVALDVWHPEGERYPALNASEMEPLDELEVSSGDEALVWIPSRPVHAGDREVQAELHSIAPGQPLLLAYDSLEALQAGCGPYQAAAAISAERIDHVAHQTGAYGVAFNAVLADEARHKAPVRDWVRESRRRHLG